MLPRIAVGLLVSGLIASAHAALEVKAQVALSPPAPGDTVPLQFRVSNTSGFSRAGVVLKMVYPQGLAPLAFGVITQGGACNWLVGASNQCDATETLTWNLGTIPAGQGVTVSLPPVVAASTTPGTVIDVVANATDSSGANASATELVEVVNSRVLQIGVSQVVQAPVTPGSNVAYQLSFGHTASSVVATNAVLSLQMPSGMAFVSATDGGVQVGSTVQWNLGTLQPGQVGERRVTLAVSGSVVAGTALKAQGSLVADGAKLAQGAVLTRVEATPGLMVGVDVNASPARPAEGLDARLIVSNASLFDRAGVVLRMRYPLGLAAMPHGVITGGGACNWVLGASNACDPTEILTWNLGTIPAGQGVAVSLPPVVAAATLPGTLIGFEAEVSDSSGASAMASDSVQVVNGRVLQLSVGEVNQAPVQPGSALAYQLSFGHTASSAVATNAVLSLPVPVGTAFVSASDGGVLVGNAVRWNLGTLLPGQVGERRVVLSVQGAVPLGTLIKAEAGLVADGDKKVLADTLTRVEAPSGLALALDMNTSPARPGEWLDAKLSVSNASAFDRAGVVLRMRYPVGLAPMSHALITGGGACNWVFGASNECDATEILTWNLGTIPAGKGLTLNLPPAVAASALPGSVIDFEAEATDSSGVRVTAQEWVQVVNSRVLQLAISEARQEPVQPGVDAPYQLSFGHTASSAVATGAVLSLPLPQGMSFVSASDGGTLVGQTVQWQLGILQPGQVGQRRVVLRPGFLPPAEASRVAKLEVTLQAAGGLMARAEDTSLIEAASPLQLEVALTPVPGEPGKPVAATLTLRNTSAFARSGVVLRLRYPQGLAPLAHTQITGSGACNWVFGASNACDGGEILTWNVGTLAANTTASFTLSPTVQAALAWGSLIEFAAEVQDATTRTRDTRVLRVGLETADRDGDGVLDTLDNCVDVPNTNQRNTDGDAFGNMCDADFNNDGNVNVLDLSAFKAAFGTQGAGLHADLNGDGVVNTLDLARFKALFGRPPGPGAVVAP